MNNRLWTRAALLSLILVLLFTPGVIDTQARERTQSREGIQAVFAQTTTNEWALGTGTDIDIRIPEALHTPYLWGDGDGGGVRLASHPADWNRQSVDLPALAQGPSGAWDEVNVAEAAVLHDGTQFMMFYSGQNAAEQWQIGLATSSDGLNWTRSPANPVLTVGAPGTWDDEEVSFSTVLYDGSTFHTWYSGFDGTNRQVGYATSPDGVSWTKSPNPVLSYGSAGAWDEALVGNPAVLYDGNVYHMWYGGWGPSDGTWSIGHATSLNRVDWFKDPANPVLIPDSEGTWDDTHVTAPTVLYDGATYRMWYGGWEGDDYGPDSYGRIGMATSPDGTAWTRSLDNPVFQPNPDGWDPLWTVDPEVLFDGEEYHLWYTGGVTYTGLQIGYANATPVYELDGTYRSPLIDTTCPEGFLPFWQSFYVEQDLNGQGISYALLNEDGQEIPDFSGFWSQDPSATFDLTALPWSYDRIYLRARLLTALDETSPVLGEWQVIWECRHMPHRIHLPVQLKTFPSSN